MSPQYYFPPRQTGRTTRMIEQAIRDTQKGFKVLLIMGSHRERDRVKRILRHDYDAHDLIECGQIEIHNMEDRQTVDFPGHRIQGKEFNTVYRDHFALETYYRDLLEEVHRWDVLEYDPLMDRGPDPVKPIESFRMNIKYRKGKGD